MAEVRTTAEIADDRPAHRPAVGLLLAAGVIVLLVVGLVAETRESAPLPGLARYAMEIAQPLWHTTEPVNEIVYGTRGFDTFGETFLLLAAVIGVSTITRGKERREGFIGEELLAKEEQRPSPRGKKRSQTQARSAEKSVESQSSPSGPDDPDSEPLGHGLEKAQAMTVVARGAARTALPVLLVAGIYLAAWGYSPGGGFPAGAVVLGVVLLAYVTYGYRRVRKILDPDLVEAIEMFGALLIVLIEALGLVLEGSFTANWMPLRELQTIPSGGILQAFSGSELIEVATGLTLAVFGLLGMGRDWTPDDDE